MIAFVCTSRQSCCFPVCVCTATTNTTHCWIVAVCRDYVGIWCEICRVCCIAQHGYSTRILCASVCPMAEVVMLVRTCNQRSPFASMIHASAIYHSPCCVGTQSRYGKGWIFGELRYKNGIGCYIYQSWSSSASIAPLLKVIICCSSCNYCCLRQIVVVSRPRHATHLCILRLDGNRKRWYFKYCRQGCVLRYDKCTRIVGVAIVPTGKMIPVECRCRQFQGSAVIVETASCNGSHCLVVARNCCRIAVHNKFSREYRVLRYDYPARICCCSVAPLNKMIASKRFRRNVCCWIIVKFSASNRLSHRRIVRSCGNRMFVDCKRSRECGVPCQNYCTRIVGYAVVPLHKMVMLNGICRYCHKRIILVGSATCNISKCHIGAVGC